MLGMLLFIIYILSLGHIFYTFGIDFHFTPMIHISTKSKMFHPPLELTICMQNVNIWITKNFLKLNANITEAFLVGSRYTLSKTPFFTLFLLTFVVRCP